MLFRYLWPVWLYSTFPHCFVNGHDFRGKKLLKVKCVFWFSVQLLTAKFLNVRKFKRDMIVNVYWSSCQVPVILAIFYWNLNFLDRCFEKYSDIKFHENPSSGSRVAPCGPTERRDKYRKKLIVAFHIFSKKSTNNIILHLILDNNVCN